MSLLYLKFCKMDLRQEYERYTSEIERIHKSERIRKSVKSTLRDQKMLRQNYEKGYK